MMDAQISRHPQPHSLELLSGRKRFLRCIMRAFANLLFFFSALVVTVGVGDWIGD